MMMNHELDCRSLVMLPVANEMMNNDINDAHTQLSRLSDDLPLNEIFTNDRLQNLVNTYAVKITQTDYVKALCCRWRSQESLSDQQKIILCSLELNVLRMESVTQEVLNEIQKQLQP